MLFLQINKAVQSSKSFEVWLNFANFAKKSPKIPVSFDFIFDCRKLAIFDKKTKISVKFT